MLLAFIYVTNNRTTVLLLLFLLFHSCSDKAPHQRLKNLAFCLLSPFFLLLLDAMPIQENVLLKKQAVFHSKHQVLHYYHGNKFWLQGAMEVPKKSHPSWY